MGRTNFRIVSSLGKGVNGMRWQTCLSFFFFLSLKSIPIPVTCRFLVKMTGFCRCLWGSAVSDEWIHFQKCMVAVSYTIFVTEDCVGHSNRLRENQLFPKIADCSSIWIESRPGLEPVAWSLSCLGGSVSQAKTNTEAVHLSQAISRWVFSSVSVCSLGWSWTLEQQSWTRIWELLREFGAES